MSVSRKVLTVIYEILLGIVLILFAMTILACGGYVMGTLFSLVGFSYSPLAQIGMGLVLLLFILASWIVGHLALG